MAEEIPENVSGGFGGMNNFNLSAFSIYGSNYQPTSAYVSQPSTDYFSHPSSDYFSQPSSEYFSQPGPSFVHSEPQPGCSSQKDPFPMEYFDMLSENPHLETPAAGGVFSSEIIPNFGLKRKFIPTETNQDDIPTFIDQPIISTDLPSENIPSFQNQPFPNYGNEYFSKNDTMPGNDSNSTPFSFPYNPFCIPPFEENRFNFSSEQPQHNWTEYDFEEHQDETGQSSESDSLDIDLDDIKPVDVDYNLNEVYLNPPSSHHPRKVKYSFFQDPIIRHTMELEKFVSQTKKMFKEKQMAFERVKAKKKGINVFSSFKPMVFPRFPETFPFRSPLNSASSRSPLVSAPSRSSTVSAASMSSLGSTLDYLFRNLYGVPCSRLQSVRKSRRKKIVPVRISSARNETLSKSCVCAILLYIGFDDCQTSALNCLSKVLDDFLRKFCREILRERHSHSNFREKKVTRNVLNRTLKKRGFGGIRGLHNFYEESVILRHFEVLGRSLNLFHRCIKQNEQMVKCVKKKKKKSTNSNNVQQSDNLVAPHDKNICDPQGMQSSTQLQKECPSNNVQQSDNLVAPHDKNICDPQGMQSSTQLQKECPTTKKKKKIRIIKKKTTDASESRNVIRNEKPKEKKTAVHK